MFYGIRIICYLFFYFLNTKSTKISLDFYLGIIHETDEMYDIIVYQCLSSEIFMNPNSLILC